MSSSMALSTSSVTGVDDVDGDDHSTVERRRREVGAQLDVVAHGDGATREAVRVEMAGLLGHAPTDTRSYRWRGCGLTTVATTAR